MIRVTDATGEVMDFEQPARRIVSLVPSTTETAFALGAGERLVGVTRFCVRPAEALQRCSTVGGTKSPRLESIRELEPDLVLANQEENRREDVAALRRFTQVYVAFPRDVSSAIEEIDALGNLLGCTEAARSISTELRAALKRLREQAREHPLFSFLYLIWRNPYMAAGRGTFISAFLNEIGGENAADVRQERYPELTVDDIRGLHPDVVLFGSEPFPFREEHVTELHERLGAEQDRRPACYLVDGQALSWHGVRMREGIPYLMRLTERLREATVPGSSAEAAD